MCICYSNLSYLLCIYVFVVLLSIIIFLLVVGCVYLFFSSDGVSGWSQVVKIVASDGVASDYFGRSVSMYGNMLAVGAYGDDSQRGDFPV